MEVVSRRTALLTSEICTNNHRESKIKFEFKSLSRVWVFTLLCQKNVKNYSFVRQVSLIVRVGGVYCCKGCKLKGLVVCCLLGVIVSFFCGCVLWETNLNAYWQTDYNNKVASLIKTCPLLFESKIIMKINFES